MGHAHDHGDAHGHANPHDHSHGHSHSHSHGHSHAPADFGPAFAIGVILNSAFVVVEAVYGYISGSMALVADAGHNLSDVLALLLAWGANVASKRPASARFTFGYKSSTILAALANAMLLAIAIGAIAFETIHRIFDPVEPQGMTMIAVAGVGIAVNTFTALLFMKGRHADLNIRGAFLHMAADALVSLGVVIAGVAILFTGQSWIDPAASLLILVVIGWGTWGLARDSLRMGLHGVPSHIDEEAVAAHLAKCPGVATVHHLHIWPMSTTETALTAHLVMPGGHPGDEALAKLSAELDETFSIRHTTFQVEMKSTACEGGC